MTCNQLVLHQDLLNEHGIDTRVSNCRLLTLTDEGEWLDVTDYSIRKLIAWINGDTNE